MNTFFSFYKIGIIIDLTWWPMIYNIDLDDVTRWPWSDDNFSRKLIPYIFCNILYILCANYIYIICILYILYPNFFTPNILCILYLDIKIFYRYSLRMDWLMNKFWTERLLRRIFFFNTLPVVSEKINGYPSKWDTEHGCLIQIGQSNKILKHLVNVDQLLSIRLIHVCIFLQQPPILKKKS